MICRWHYDDIILDVMPANDKILGFGNQWYKEAIACAIKHHIFDNLVIKSVTATYFLLRR